VAAVFRSAASRLSAIQEERGTQELVISLQTRLYRALAAAHWDTVRRLIPPTITSALQTKAYDAGYGLSGLIQVITAGLLVIGYIVSVIVVFPIMLPALLVLLALMWWVNARRNRTVLVQSEDYYDAQTELHQHYEDWVAISRISSLGVDANKLADRFEAGAREAASYEIDLSRSFATTSITYEAAVVVAVLVGVPIAWWLETPPALLAFALVSVVRVLPRAGSIQSGYQGLINAVAPLRSIDKLATSLENDAVVPPASGKKLEWQHLKLANIGVEDTQREGGQRWILKDVNLELKHGEWLALTGPTGAGKTTLAEVLLMLLRPDAGDLHIDGSVADDDLANRWRDQAAYVPQDVVLIDASIRDNLRLYVPDATDYDLKTALVQAAAEFVMERLPEGLDTRAGPGGRWLSGGERQRIGIARALLRKPGFLVLDEPTAALDNETQTKLMSALGNLEHTMSVVLITHRLELIKLADRVIEITDGALTKP
jgi:ATP-binding cassette subfamily C protein